MENHSALRFPLVTKLFGAAGDVFCVIAYRSKEFIEAMWFTSSDLLSKSVRFVI